MNSSKKNAVKLDAIDKKSLKDSYAATILLNPSNEYYNNPGVVKIAKGSTNSHSVSPIQQEGKSSN